MPRLSRSPLTTVATAALVGSVVLGGGVAWAAWSASGSGAGATAANSLVTPVLTATRSTSSPTSAIDLSWTAPGQLPGTTYSVKRDGTTPLSCTSSPCTDSGLTSGTTYSYVVTAKLGSNWSAASNSASASTQAAVNATSYMVSAASPATAGTPAQVTITAKRPDSSTDTGYTGSKSLTLSGTSTATSPANISATLPTSATFNNGVAVLNVTFVTAGSGLGLTATTGSLTGSTTVSVNAAAPARLGFTSTSTNKSTSVDCLLGCAPTALGGGGSFTTKVSLLDQYGNAATHTSNVVVALTAGSGGSLDRTSLTISAGSSESGLSAKLSESGNWSSDSLTASSSSPALTSVTANVSK